MYTLLKRFNTKLYFLLLLNINLVKSFKCSLDKHKYKICFPLSNSGFNLPINGYLLKENWHKVRLDNFISVLLKAKRASKIFEREVKGNNLSVTIKEEEVFKILEPILKNYTKFEVDNENRTFLVKNYATPYINFDLDVIDNLLAETMLLLARCLGVISLNSSVQIYDTTNQLKDYLQYCCFITDKRLRVTSHKNSKYNILLFKDKENLKIPNQLLVQTNLWTEDAYCVRVPLGNIVIRNRGNLLVVGNCHRASSKDYSELIQKIPSYNRIFLSGTPLANESILRKIELIKLSGTEIVKIENKTLIDKGVSQKPNIHLYSTSDTESKGFNDQYNKLKFSLDRLVIIANYVKENNKVLIAVKDIDHGEFILNKLKSLGKNIKFISAESEDRFTALDDFERGDLDCLISSLILKEGVNIPSMRVLILALGGKSEITIKQLIGRALRDDKINKDVLIVDFNDKGKHLSKHSLERLKIYEQEGFEVQHKN
jgi:hypothetical protein